MPPRTVTVLTAFVIAADPIVARDERKHAHESEQRDLLAEYAAGIAVAQATTSMSSSATIITGALETYVRYLSGDWAREAAVRIVSELRQRKPLELHAVSASTAPSTRT